MKKIFALLALVGCGMALSNADPQAAQKSEKANSMIGTVIHMNSGDSERQGHGLKNVANILKEVPDAKVEVVYHGAGISLLVQGDTKHADKVQELIGNGVSFIACENTLKDKFIPSAAKPQIRNPNLEIRTKDGRQDACKTHSCWKERI